MRRDVFAVPPSGPTQLHHKSFFGFCEPDPLRHLMGLSCVTIVFGDGDCRVTVANQPPILCRAPFVRGVSPHAAFVEHLGQSNYLWLTLTPLAAMELLGASGADLREGIVPLSALIGDEAEELAACLVNQPYPAQRLVLDAWVRARLNGGAKRNLPENIVRAWLQVVSTGGQFPVSEISDELGCSRRYLARHFGEIVGVPPKPYGRMLRFDFAMASFWRGRESLGSIAQRWGYFDQAHFNRDAREFLGMSPTALHESRVTSGADTSRLDLVLSAALDD